ncbi:peptidase U32 family protein [Sulfurimonas autotrophica]|uniref:Collagenase n=1 Tax=Sulfurimonas autotrophica (strain ATCC BAA-671 / DSM 16294 / JCM 11897 / OK10) TaxID=563040 RepID=E0UQB0_SULAO|nr:peptidase U32 family protein [Sulfurimonas autotrophica]ADN09853.1 collagenase [Sulfurimonas autotrophica DSM 16294]
MNNKKVELLSPAGTLEKLKIALDFGADAVYGGVSHFSLRIRSGKEFSFEDFEEGIKYAHDRGKKVYATINGFPFNSQLNLLKKHILKMGELKPDAFIVATPGVLKLCHDLVPDMPLHLSTQANVMNVLDAQIYHEMGATRIITAREISLRDLKEIKAALPDLELEVFVHGSMCFAYSGRCLISTLQSGRVPNRGSCANDCRFPYEMYAANPETGTLFKLEEDAGVGTYIMNSKDLNLASHMQEILDSGAVDSIKIEGRTKTTYYAATTAKAYRMAIDDYYEDKLDSERYQYELQSLQNRGYTDAYLISRPFEKHDTQSLDFTMQLGTHQVSGVVNAEGTHFLCKYKTLPGDEMEVVSPLGSEIEIVDNEIGTTYEKDGKFFVKLKQLKAQNGKIWEEVHSGNINPIELPTKFPSYTFFRIPANADMNTAPK